MNVVILGASNKPERYSYRALQQLRAQGHTPLPVHPALTEIEGVRVYPRLEDVPGPIDTVTVYLSAANSTPLAAGLLGCKARRVIFNPGAENPPLARQLEAAGVEALEACTLVLLRTGQF